MKIIYCGVGCQIEYNVKDNKIKYVNGVDGPAQIVLGLWFFVQLSSGLNSLGIDTNGGVAWFAHIGG